MPTCDELPANIERQLKVWQSKETENPNNTLHIRTKIQHHKINRKWSKQQHVYTGLKDQNIVGKIQGAW